MAWQLIIAGVEPTPEGLWAAATAHRLARAEDARCVLVRAVRDVWSSPSHHITIDVSPYREAVLANAREEMLEALARSAPEARAWPLEVRGGRPSRVLRDVAREMAADLLVLGGKHHLAPTRWLGGSTAHEAARIVDAPVLVSTLSGPHFRRVLGAVDLSAAAGPVIAAAERMAQLEDAALRFIYALEPLPFMGTTADLAIRIDEFVERDMEILNGTVWPKISLARAERVVRRGFARSVIATEAAEWKADLLVVGSHGRGWADRLVLGSITQGLLSDLPCSVLVIPVHEQVAAETPRAPAAAGATA